MNTEAGRPNVIVVLVDDLGVRDLGCTGSTFHETPRLDRMASEGVRFNNAYAASSLCSLSRAAILTGRHPVRVDITNYIGGRGMGRMIGPRHRQSLGRDERTVGAAPRTASRV